MKNEFVPYELAIKLKELGFDEPCFGYYDGGGNLYTEMVEVLKAPLYQQVFRFFREKYGLGHMINGIGHESFIMNIGGVLHIFNAFEFQTYEEAELACLDKLIDIVKLNQNKDD
jgi:hypothetical protein